MGRNRRPISVDVVPELGPPSDALVDFCVAIAPAVRRPPLGRCADDRRTPVHFRRCLQSFVGPRVRWVRALLVGEHERLVASTRQEFLRREVLVAPHTYGGVIGKTSSG